MNIKIKESASAGLVFRQQPTANVKQAPVLASHHRLPTFDPPYINSTRKLAPDLSKAGFVALEEKAKLDLIKTKDMAADKKFNAPTNQIDLLV